MPDEPRAMTSALALRREELQSMSREEFVGQYFGVLDPMLDPVYERIGRRAGAKLKELGIGDKPLIIDPSTGLPRRRNRT